MSWSWTAHVRSSLSLGDLWRWWLIASWRLLSRFRSSATLGWLRQPGREREFWFWPRRLDVGRETRTGDEVEGEYVWSLLNGGGIWEVRETYWMFCRALPDAGWAVRLAVGSEWWEGWAPAEREAGGFRCRGGTRTCSSSPYRGAKLDGTEVRDARRWSGHTCDGCA